MICTVVTCNLMGFVLSNSQVEAEAYGESGDGNSGIGFFLHVGHASALLHHQMFLDSTIFTFSLCLSLTFSD